jgi:hypothetical protein
MTVTLTSIVRFYIWLGSYEHARFIKSTNMEHPNCYSFVDKFCSFPDTHTVTLPSDKILVYLVVNAADQDHGKILYHCNQL